MSKALKEEPVEHHHHPLAVAVSVLGADGLGDRGDTSQTTWATWSYGRCARALSALVLERR